METSRRARRLGRAFRAVVAVAVLAAAVVMSGCGAQVAQVTGEGSPRVNAEALPTRSVGIDGVSIELLAGWDAYTRPIGRGETVRVIWAASRRFAEPSPRPEFPYETLAGLAEDGIAIEVVVQRTNVDSATWPLLARPVSLADGYFLANSYEGQPAPHVSTQIIEARVSGRALYVQVYFGRNKPDEPMRAMANRVLASLTVTGSAAVPSREVDADGFVRFEDPEVGVSGRYPDRWHRARALTNLILPREVLALATYPLRGEAKAGECAPDTARADMPPDGAFIWLLEYRPQRGDVWADLPRERFPPRPSRFEIPRHRLEPVSCFSGPGYSTTFRAADRPFQLLVAFGGRPTDEQVAEVEDILTSLRFEELPPPAPDPYAGWPLVNDNPGDSLRPPPGWPAAAAMFPPGKTPRPRPLFFASSRPLPGLPQKLIPYVDELPGPFPSLALANGFPPDGVLLWVLEEKNGNASPQFPLIDRRWPAHEQFREAPAPTTTTAQLRWLRAGGSFRGYRFSVWIATGPQARDTDLELALKSAASLAVSGCWRDAIDDCPDQ